MAFVAFVLGVLATFSQVTPPPAAFVAGMFERSAPLLNEGFVGLVWPCDAPVMTDDTEECYAGLGIIGAPDGAPVWALTTGP